MNKIVTDLMSKYDNHNYILDELRENLLVQRLSIDKKFLVETYHAIKKLFQEQKFYLNKNPDKVNGITNNKLIEVFSVVLNSTVQNLFHKLKLDEILEVITSLEKDSIRAMNEIFVKGQPETSNDKIFTVENLEWALLTVESRVKFINYQAYMLPMIDLFSLKNNRDNSKKKNESFTDDKAPVIKAFDKFNKGDVLYDNDGLGNDSLLISKMDVLLDNDNDF